MVINLGLLVLTSTLAIAAHPFPAENNFICEVCTTSVDYIKTTPTSFLLQGQFSNDEKDIRSLCSTKVDGTETTFSTACDTVVKNYATIKQLAKARVDPKTICEQINMCSDYMLEKRWERIPTIQNHIIRDINADEKMTWKAGINHKWINSTLADVRRYLGTIVDPDHVYTLPVKEFSQDEITDIPDSFDPRDKWPNCKDVIGHIRDQSACGSCWAFGSTEAFNDRHCIQSGKTVVLSADDTTACCKFFPCASMGCNGGQPSLAWSWFASKGVVTGGDYNDKDTCLPYAFPACAHHVTSTKYPACPSSEYSTPKCDKSCTNTDYQTSYSDDKFKASTSYSLDSVTKIQQDILNYGSATGAFTVYADFPNYKSGVYQHKTGRALGGHAIKIQGWGTENGTPYWLVANSWNETWGDNGYFKILRGSNECGIEGQVSAGATN